MAASVSSFTASALNSTTTPKTVTALSWTAGDVIVVIGGAETADTTLNNPTNANLTFGAPQASNTAGGAGDCDVYVWRAVAGSTQTGQTISCSRGATSGQWGFFVWVDTGVSSTANPSANLTESNFTFTPTAGSIVHYAFFDWNANNTDQTIATGTGTATERADSRSAAYGWYAGDWVGVTATSTGFGITDFTGLRIAHGVIEVLASAGSVTGTVAVTQAADTATASGWITVTGTSARTQVSQTSTASGVLGYSGTVARTQANQTSTASGWIEITGTVTETQDSQTSSASGSTGGVNGSAAASQANQTSTASGVLGYSGTVAVTQASQTSAASGTVGGAGEITGSVAETQDDQTSTATGKNGVNGATAANQANQTASASGWITVTGTVAETQDGQTSTASGKLGYSGSVAAIQAGQTGTASGWILVTGLVTETQDNQTSTADGFVGDIPDIPEILTLTAVTAGASLTAITAPFTLEALED